MTDEQIAADLVLLRTDTIVGATSREVHGVASHPEDDLILSIAASENADYLVTGDAELLRLGSHEGVTILSPRSFVDLLGSDT